MTRFLSWCKKKVITQELWEAGLYTQNREGILISCSIFALYYPAHFSFEFILWIFRPCQQNTREYIPVFFKILSINWQVLFWSVYNYPLLVKEWNKIKPGYLWSANKTWIRFLNCQAPENSFSLARKFRVLVRWWRGHDPVPPYHPGAKAMMTEHQFWGYRIGRTTAVGVKPREHRACHWAFLQSRFLWYKIRRGQD